MRLSRSVINNLCVLSLINSVVEQMEFHKKEYPEKMRRSWVRLKLAQSRARERMLESAGIGTKEGIMQLPEKEYRRWVRHEQRLFDTVLAAVPEKTLDARMWVTAVLLVCESHIESIPATARDARSTWSEILLHISEIYNQYDPEWSCIKQMQDGAFRGEKILEALQ